MLFRMFNVLLHFQPSSLMDFHIINFYLALMVWTVQTTEICLHDIKQSIKVAANSKLITTEEDDFEIFAPKCSQILLLSNNNYSTSITDHSPPILLNSIIKWIHCQTTGCKLQNYTNPLSEIKRLVDDDNICSDLSII